MSEGIAVRCEVQGLRAAYGRQRIEFDIGSDLTMHVEGEVGPRGLSPVAADLIDLGAAVYQIERQLRGRQRTNPAVRFDLSIQLRRPQVWSPVARAALAEALGILGNATWNVEVEKRHDPPVAEHRSASENGIDRIVLFSGGLDSASGAATGKSHASTTRLASFYTRQKTLQQDIARHLGFQPPVQWRMSWQPQSGRGHTFRYRSFLFFCLAVAVAESWGTRRVLQYENGILATAIPPAPAWLMTRHAFPPVQQLMAKLAAAIFGERWTIENPFLKLTKRQCLQEARRVIGPNVMDEIAERTETCWFHWSNRVTGGRKTPGVACGVCIPCLVRRTAMPDEAYAWDLRKDRVRNDPNLGLAFRSYYGFLREVDGARHSLGSFYRILPVPGRELHITGLLTLQELYDLFERFANEFMETFRL
jgi:7-cyano-7-deazaguanine synthase in queuosine biosynthesis